MFEPILLRGICIAHCKDTLNMYTVQYKYSKSGICKVVCLCKSVMTSNRHMGDIVGRLPEL